MLYELATTIYYHPILSTLFFTGSYIIIRFDLTENLVNIVSDTCKRVKFNSHRFKKTKDKITSNLRLFKNMTGLIYMYTMYTIKQKISNNIKKIDKHTYLIDYQIQGRHYQFMVQHTYKGPCPVLMVVDEYNEDVSNLIVPMLGPNYDAYSHSVKLTPRFFKRAKLEFCMINGETLEFHENDQIRF